MFRISPFLVPWDRRDPGSGWFMRLQEEMANIYLVGGMGTEVIFALIL